MTPPYDACRKHPPHDDRLALPIEQGVLLWCMRMWVIGLKRGLGVEPRITGVLETLGAPAASPCLKDFMLALSSGCTRMIEVRCVCHPLVGPDERALLDALALTQAMRPFEALLLLRGFVTQAGATAALQAAEGVGTALAQAGWFLPEPEQEMRHFAMTQAAPRTGPGLERCIDLRARGQNSAPARFAPSLSPTHDLERPALGTGAGHDPAARRGQARVQRRGTPRAPGRRRSKAPAHGCSRRCPGVSLSVALVT